nr:NADH dehydrogenase subunit 2 [Typhlomys daloushanensis]
MNPMAMTTIMFSILMGPLITMMSSHTIMMWIGLEMNMLAIIPILTNNHNPRSTEAATKYFLSQATASMILMLAITNNFLHTNQWTLLHNTDSMTNMLMTISMIMKLGAAPFHFWVPEVTQGINTSSGLILLTWQKIGPLSILYQLSNTTNHNIMLISASLSILLGAWGGLNQTQLRKIMAYSSIAHMGWMLAIMTFSPHIMLLNLTIYITLTLCMFTTMTFNSMTTTLSMSIMWNKMPTMILTMLISLLSLGGLPPLTGFLPKWTIINDLISNNNLITSLTMAITALINLFFYMRIVYSTSLTMFPSFNNSKLTWHQTNPKNITLMAPLTITTSLSLPLAPLLSTLM